MTEGGLAEVAHPIPNMAATLDLPEVAPRRSPAGIVIGLALTLIAVIFAVFAFLCWQGYGTTIEGAKAKAQTAADLVADDTRLAFGSGLTALRFIADMGPTALDPAYRSQIDSAIKRLPAEMHLGLYDASGAPVGTGNGDGLPASIAGTDYYAALKQGQDWVLPPLGADPTNMIIAQRLGSDSFAGVAVLAVPMSLLQTFWEPQHLGTDSTLVLNREDGWMLGRYPALAGPLNVSKGAAYWSEISSNPSGTYATRSQVDGITRVVGFRHIPELGVIAFGTISQDTAIQGLWTSIITVLWLMVPIALGLLIFALITARMLRTSERTQAKLAAAVEHNQVLFREIHHRVKNNLQSVASLLQMQPIAREIKTDMGQRLAAMSAVHEHIYRSNNFATVQVKTYLETLIENIRAAADPKVRVVAQLDDLSVDKDAATPLGLIVNEVVANAFKHAFPDGREGVITVQLAHDSTGRGRLTVADNGVGFDPDKPAKGIGQRLIRALTGQLGGESTMASGDAGSTFELTFPLAATEG